MTTRNADGFEVPSYASYDVRSIWRCERCNAYHIGGLDIHDDENDVVAVCGARWIDNQPQ